MRRRLASWLGAGAASVAVAVAVAVGSMLGPVGPAAAAGPPSASAPAVDRMLILSLPYLTWSDVGARATPQLDALLDRAAVGNLAVRAARRLTTPGDGYATIGAGTRAGAPREAAGLALAPDERLEGGTAAEVYRRRTGMELGPAAAANLSVARYRSVNDRLLFGGEVGALGDALAAAGVTPAVVANADRSGTRRDPLRFGRQAVTALMDREGRLVAGRVDAGLLRPDPEAPYGHRLDRGAVDAAFAAAWRPRSVVLVEGSDLVRAESYADLVTADRRAVMRRTALAWTDEIVGDVLGRVDLERDAVLVVAPATPGRQARLTVAALAVPGGRGALLRSSSTRRAGFVTIADAGPTVLDVLGVDRPASMEGRPMEAGRTGGDAADRRRYLIGTERDARFRDRLVTPVAAGFVVAQVALSAGAVVVLRRDRRGRARSAVEVASLALLAFLPCTYLAALVPFSRLGTAAYLAAVVGAAVLLAVAGRALDRGRRDLLPVALTLTLILAVVTASVMAGSRLQLSTVFGDSPIVAWRFTGIGNLTFAQYATAAILLAGLIAHRLGGRRGAWAAAALLAGVLVVEGLPAWGADIGGVLSLTPAFAVVVALLFGVRLGPRTLIAVLGATAVALAVFLAFDLAGAPSERSHLGRLFEQTGGGGWAAFSRVVERKLDANLSVLTRSVWTLMVPAVLAFLSYLVYRSPSALGRIQRRLPELRVSLVGIAVAGALGFALNDSGIAIPGMMLGVLNPVLVYLSARWA